MTGDSRALERSGSIRYRLAMRDLLESTSRRPLLVGVVHLAPLPGAPRFGGDVGIVLERAREDARGFAEGNLDAVIVENFGDAPFFAGTVPPETVAAMALAIRAVHEEAPRLAIGANVLRNDARTGLGLCAATGASFLRVNVHTGAMVTDQGIIEGAAAETLRERERLCPQVAILADVHVKHATPLGDETVEEAAIETLGRGLADALVVSGTRTGSPPSLEELTRVRERVGPAPLLVGSGLDVTNARELLSVADGAIVGTSLKRDGLVTEPVDPARVRRLREL